MTRAAVLLSTGRHPASGRPRLAEAEASAIALAVAAGLRPRLVHAGRPQDAEVLRPALGMRAEQLDLLPIAPSEDPLDRLTEHLSSLGVDLVLTGDEAETGEASGFLPFVLAERLARPLIANCTHLSPEPDGWRVATALPGGARRHLRARGPLVLTVGAAGPRPPFSAFAAARRGRIAIVGRAAAGAAQIEAADHRTSAASAIDPRLACPVRAARARPRPIAGPPSGDPAQRLATILGGGRPAGNRRLVDVDAEAAAAAILEELTSAGCLLAADHKETAS